MVIVSLPILTGVKDSTASGKWNLLYFYYKNSVVYSKFYFKDYISSVIFLNSHWIFENFSTV